MTTARSITESAIPTGEANRSLVKLRDDLLVVPQTEAGKRIYVIENPLTGSYYRMGPTEYRFASFLDGMTSEDEALRLASSGVDEPLTLQQASAVCKRLMASDLAQPVSSHTAPLERSLLGISGTCHPHLPVQGEIDSGPAARGKSFSKRGLALHPLFARIPLGCPDRFLSAIYPWLGWIHSRFVIALALVAGTWAVVKVCLNWDVFIGSTRAIFAGDQHLGLLAGWVVLKGFHELSHGLACKKYGGFVREAGLVLVLFAPSPYIDVTSCWRFTSKWFRMHVALAGMLAEFTLAALATFVWSWTPSGALNQWCAHLVVMASVTTLLFNANPLMRFDGYYVLADWLEIPNLATKGEQYVGYLAKKFLLTVPANPPQLPPERALLIKTYGVSAFLWRSLTFVSIGIAATSLFHGAGLTLVVAWLLLWLVPLIKRIGLALQMAPGGIVRNSSRALVSSVAVASLILAFLWWVPWLGAVRAPGVIDYADAPVVRAESPGFINTLRVHDGEVVNEGQILAILENADLQLEHRLLELSVQQSLARSRVLKHRHELAAAQAEDKQREAFEKQLVEKSGQVAQLTVRAPRDGKVVRRDLASQLGQYAPVGFEICRIGNENRKEVNALFEQNDIDSLQAHVGKVVNIALGKGIVSARLLRVEPRAIRSVSYPSLTADNGGPLPVRVTTTNGVAADDVDPVELLTPRFIANVLLADDDSIQVFAGQRCTVTLPGVRATLFQALYESISGWLRPLPQDR